MAGDLDTIAGDHELLEVRSQLDTAADYPGVDRAAVAVAALATT